jgi:regulatory protein
MQITGLKPIVRRPGFVAVEVDGVRSAVLPVERVQALSLGVGQELGEAQAAALESAGEAEKAHEAALRLLAARPRSVRGMRQRLWRKGFAPDAVSEAVGRLEAAGLLDDAEFARSYARARAQRGYGPARILAELARSGVERRVAEDAVGEAGSHDDQTRLEQVRALAAKRSAQLLHLPVETRVRRVAAYLARRGYRGGDVLRAVRAAAEPR